MRFVTLAAALIVAVAIAACGGQAVIPKADSAHDAAFVAGLRVLCSKTPAVVPIDPSASAATITNTANADNATVIDFLYGPLFRGRHGRLERHGGLSVLTPTISDSSPLALPVTAMAAMALDMSKWYTLIVEPSNVDTATTIRGMVQTVVARQSQALTDLAKIGITGCLD
jgi:hypothetical protein